MAASDELTSNEFCLLALLVEAPRHGWGLSTLLARDGELGSIWSMARPLVYTSLRRLESDGYIETAGIERGDRGPHRVIFRATPAGRRAVREWLREPVEHVRDVRSLLMLKLLFLNRAGADPGPLLETQRAHFVVHADRLATAADQAEGFDRTLLLWRLHSTAAVIRFAETMLGDPAAAPLTA